MSIDIHEHINETTVHALLGTSGDNRVDITIDWDGSEFVNSWCDIIPHVPAAVWVDYTRRNTDGCEEDVEASFSLKAAPSAVSSILTESAVLDAVGINVRVNGHAFAYTLPYAG
ncbi:hypothetical protein [Nocardia africana]